MRSDVIFMIILSSVGATPDFCHMCDFPSRFSSLFSPLISVMILVVIILPFLLCHLISVKLITAVSTKVVSLKGKSVRDNADWYYE